MPQPPDSLPERPPATGSTTQDLRWQVLLHELQSLNAQLEYLRLMIKLGVR